MTQEETRMRAGWVSWIVAGCLLTLVVAFIWILAESITALVFLLGIGFGVAIASIIAVSDALVSSLLRQMQMMGEGMVRMLSIRGYMRAVLAVWIFGVFTLVVAMTAFGYLDTEKFNLIMGVLGSFVASVVAYYFTTSRNEENPQ
ncbi:hypothetical protein EU546_05445 [Candidatus Thorarchaeota archaeon]|nr:MAG: hypothetical protein EU546_05445 [Candidatus Thorarchaeota archaeon]